MRRVKDNKYGYRSWMPEDLLQYGKYLLPPLLLVVVVVLILVVNRADTQETGLEETVAEEETVAQEETILMETEAETEAEVYEFSTEDYPEIQELMSTYFTALQNADVETIYRLFGWTDTTGMEALRSQLQYNARYTEGYRNIVCYTEPGLEEGAYLVYISYDLKFKNSLTLAPGFLWNYVKTAEDGSLYLTDSAELTQDELDFIAEAEMVDEIVLLKTQIYAKLRLALEEDADLAESYSILERQGGASGAAEPETQHEVTVQIGVSDETEESSTTEEEEETDAAEEESSATEEESSAAEGESNAAAEESEADE